MSKLEELIKEFCPNGVEYKRLSEVCEFNRGTSITSKDAQVGNIPVISGGQKPAFYHNVSNRPANTITVAGSGAYAGYVAIWDKPIFCADSFSVDIIDENRLNKRYLYHYLLSKQTQIYAKKQGAGIPHVHGKNIANLQIPLPALPVQREIVRILDSFTLYSAELTAELTARRKQYEFYRDKLLQFDSGNIPRVKLKDIATEFYRGYGITREQVTKEGIPCVRYGEIYTTYNTWFDKCVSYTKVEDIASPKYFEYGDILFAITGESVEDIAKSAAYIGNEKCLAGGDIVVMKHKQNPKFLAYALSTFDARQQKSKGKIKSKVVHSNVPSIENIEIYLPPIDVQERIVKVLDNFDAICSDLSAGLPAEIEHRQKQYEYYRDKLLTFEGKNNNGEK